MFKKTFAVGLIGLTSIIGATAITTNLSNSNVDTNKTNTLVKPTSNTSDKSTINIVDKTNKKTVGDVTIYNEEVNGTSYKATIDVMFRRGYGCMPFSEELNESDDWDYSVSLIDETNHKEVYKDTITFNNKDYLQSGWTNGNIIFGVENDTSVILSENTTYSWQYDFNIYHSTINKDLSYNHTPIDTYTEKVSFTTGENNDSTTPPYTLESTSNTSAKLTYNDIIDSTISEDIKVNLTGTGIDESYSNWVSVSDLTSNSITINGLQEATTYSDWKVGVKSEYVPSGNNIHEEYYTLPEFTTASNVESLNSQVYESVDSVSLKAEYNDLYPNKIAYTYTFELKQDLNDIIDSVTIYTDSKSKSILKYNSVTIQGNKLVSGSPITATTMVDKNVSDLTTSIEIDYVGYAEPVNINIKDDSVISDFTRDEALKTPKHTTEEKLLISLLTFIVTVTMLLLVLSILIIKQNDKIENISEN